MKLKLNCLRRWYLIHRRYCTESYSSSWYWVLSEFKTGLDFIYVRDILSVTKKKTLNNGCILWRRKYSLFCWFHARLTVLFSSYVRVHRWESDQHLKIQRRSISKSLFTWWGLAGWTETNILFFLLITPPDIFSSFYLTCLYLPVSWSISEVLVVYLLLTLVAKFISLIVTKVESGIQTMKWSLLFIFSK